MRLLDWLWFLYSLNRVFLNLNIYELKTQDICICAHTHPVQWRDTRWLLENHSNRRKQETHRSHWFLTVLKSSQAGLGSFCIRGGPGNDTALPSELFFYPLSILFFAWEMVSICKWIFFSFCLPSIPVQKFKGLSSFCIRYPFNFKVTMFVCLLSCFSHVWLCCYSSVRGIFQAKILEWAARPTSRGSSQPRDQTHVSLFIMV